MKERRFNRFLAPLFGSFTGAFLSLKAVDDPDGAVPIICFGAFIGLIAGLLIVMFDHPIGMTLSSEKEPDVDGVLIEPKVHHRVAAFVSMVTGWLPIIGPVIAVVGFLATRKCRGWPRVVSLTGLCLGIITTILVFGILILHELDRYNLSQD